MKSESLSTSSYKRLACEEETLSLTLSLSFCYFIGNLHTIVHLVKSAQGIHKEMMDVDVPGKLRGA